MAKLTCEMSNHLKVILYVARYNSENESLFDVCKYPLYYNFQVPPCLSIAHEKSTGRFFIYDNNDTILVYSNRPVKTSVVKDKSKPLMEMHLLDKDVVRVNPTVFVLENDYYENTHLLLVAGGYGKYD